MSPEKQASMVIAEQIIENQNLSVDSKIPCR